MKRRATRKKTSAARGASIQPRVGLKRRRLAVCVRNTGYEASLERNKIYVVLPDDEAVRSTFTPFSLRGWRSQERGGSNPPFRSIVSGGVPCTPPRLTSSLAHGRPALQRACSTYCESPFLGRVEWCPGGHFGPCDAE
jgi:hypothetical protein